MHCAKNEMKHVNIGRNGVLETFYPVSVLYRKSNAVTIEHEAKWICAGLDTLELCNIYDYPIILPLYFYISNDLSSNAS